MYPYYAKTHTVIFDYGREKLKRISQLSMANFTTEVAVKLWFEGYLWLEELQRIHELPCRDYYPSLYRRLQRQGYHWPEMAKEAVELQSACTQC